MQRTQPPQAAATTSLDACGGGSTISDCQAGPWGFAVPRATQLRACVMGLELLWECIVAGAKHRCQMDLTGFLGEMGSEHASRRGVVG